MATLADAPEILEQRPAEAGYPDDLALVRGFAARQPEAVRLITARNNQRLFRAAWAILRNRAEAEDAVQSAYLKAFAAAATFEARCSLTTWLTRIAINEALGRRRAAQRRMAGLDGNSVTVLDDYRDKMMRGSTTTLLPDGALARLQIRQMLEEAIARLPDNFRTVFVLREIEGMSVEEVAAALAIAPATVKTRTLRARQRLREALAPDIQTALQGTFPFAGVDCVAITQWVERQICA
jgi:RNA polymerase sigma-70 factor, ECF subfamily